MYALPQYGGACIVQRAVGALSTDIPCAGSALAVLACRISVILRTNRCCGPPRKTVV